MIDHVCASAHAPEKGEAQRGNQTATLYCVFFFHIDFSSFRNGFIYKYTDPYKSTSSFHAFLTTILSSKRIPGGIPFPTILPIWWKWQLDVFMLWRYTIRIFIENLLFHPRFFLIIFIITLFCALAYQLNYYLAKIKED
jgi:hypothetical protein